MAEITKADHQLSKKFYFIKISYVLAEYESFSILCDVFFIKKGVESKCNGLKVNAKKTKMIGSENARKVAVEGNFPCVLCKKGVVSNLSFTNFAGLGCIRDVVLEVN